MIGSYFRRIRLNSSDGYSVVKSQLFLVGGGHQSRFVDFAQLIDDVERKSHVCFLLKLPYCFWTPRPSEKMRLDESFHMRYTMLQNTLLVTICDHFSVSVVFSRVPLN